MTVEGKMRWSAVDERGCQTIEGYWLRRENGQEIYELTVRVHGITSARLLIPREHLAGLAKHMSEPDL
jgi:hypothetical protein